MWILKYSSGVFIILTYDFSVNFRENHKHFLSRRYTFKFKLLFIECHNNKTTVFFNIKSIMENKLSELHYIAHWLLSVILILKALNRKKLILGKKNHILLN